MDTGYLATVAIAQAPDGFAYIPRKSRTLHLDDELERTPVYVDVDNGIDAAVRRTTTMFAMEADAWRFTQRFNQSIYQSALAHAITRNLLYSEYAGYNAYSNKSLNLMYAEFAA